jgi:hypothetical protein
MSLHRADYPDREPLGGWDDHGVEERRWPIVGLLTWLAVVAVVIAALSLTRL